ncbi:hypothetical protein LOK49_LG06G03348 [Camellia lanceoleosa]|uniref:Uncharacterized protein n=1 Tax=Camellia lanceoleosa TaxID=1840588 RepID=A0ACC0H8U9_9ERIC|nr:hypothetical protein LOK49_LG06G03348 [Camellia lanceoleosa]
MQEKKALREEKLKQEEKYMWVSLDGVKEKVSASFDLCRDSGETSFVNPSLCCEKYSKLEASRNALRQGVKIQNELIDKLQKESLNFKKGMLFVFCLVTIKLMVNRKI